MHHVSVCEHLARTQKKWEPPLPTRVGKKKKRGPDPSQKRKCLQETAYTNRAAAHPNSHKCRCEYDSQCRPCSRRRDAS